MENKGEIIIYKEGDGRSQLEVRLSNETIWLDCILKPQSPPRKRLIFNPDWRDFCGEPEC